MGRSIKVWEPLLYTITILFPFEFSDIRFTRVTMHQPAAGDFRKVW